MLNATHAANARSPVCKQPRLVRATIARANVRVSPVTYESLFSVVREDISDRSLEIHPANPSAVST